jgi:uncharacterized protein (TIGR03083 family)
VATLRQYYGSPVVPLVVESDPRDAVTAWHSQRSRLRGWLDGLPDDAWSGPTRCEGWDTSLLVRHLSSATQFLGYTLAEASGGTATTLLQGMDTRTTVAAAAEQLGTRRPDEARQMLAGADGYVDAALDRLGDAGLQRIAEGPPGHMAAHLVLRHFLFDSWVHEYDLRLPRGEPPEVDPLETEVVVGYLIGLASIGDATPVALDLRIADPDLRIGVDVVDGAVIVTPERIPPGASVVEGRATDVVDRMSGRTGGVVSGDDIALGVLDRMALVFAS